MKPICLSHLAAAVGALLLSAAAHAATDVYSQPPSGSPAATSAVYNVGPTDPGFTWSLDQDAQAWVYFSLPADVTFNRISWYGSSGDGNFAVDLFAASCFSCGANLVQTGGTFSSNLLPDAGPYAAAQVHMSALPTAGLYAYYIDLSAPVTLSASSAYAISVVNNYTSAPFVWGGSATGSGTHLQYVVGQAMFLPGPGNLAFALTDTSAVPESSSAWMLALGLGVLWGAAYKAGSRRRAG
ncbi:MAG: hypothetical protein KGN16_06220 [Burkholderiales bacterium]|nr:hypothetical protein [Burkholderiales bacterium]